MLYAFLPVNLIVLGGARLISSSMCIIIFECVQVMEHGRARFFTVASFAF